MPIRNVPWYNQNAGISYPVDDTATAIDNLGKRLPSNILVDLNLRWPSLLGQHAFLASVTVTTKLVTVTIQAALTTEDGDSFTPLAVVSIPQPIQQGRMYAVQAQAPGVGGWIVFGSGVVDTPYQGRFASPVQSLLTARAARAYRPLPVSSMGILYNNGVLNGVVSLKAVAPIEIVKESREIQGAERDVVVIRVVDNTGTSGFPVPAQGTALLGSTSPNIFQQLAGPCAGRPESSTCGNPAPMEFINSVAPDCNGVITLEFLGCAEVTQIIDGCGIAIDCGLGLVDACLPPQLPNSEGLLPDEYTPTNVPVPPAIEPPPPTNVGSESFVLIGALPYEQCFNDFPGDFIVKAGAWYIADDDVPTSECAAEQVPVYSESFSISDSMSVSFSEFSHYDYIPGSMTSNTAATRNVVVWEGFDDTTMFRKVTTDAKLLDGPAGAKHNGGIVANFRPHETLAGQFVYFLIEFDYDTQEFRISHFNGSNFQTLVPASVPGIQLDKWYRITVIIRPASFGGATIMASLESVTDPGEINVSVTVAIANYTPSTGHYGLCTNRALTEFSFFRVEASDG